MPYLRDSHPNPPPSVSPATPVVELIPDGVGQPERLRLVIQVAQRRAGADVRDARLGDPRERGSSATDRSSCRPRRRRCPRCCGPRREPRASARSRARSPPPASRRPPRCSGRRAPDGGRSCRSRSCATRRSRGRRAEQRSAHCAPQRFDPRGVDRSGSPVRSSDGDRAHSISRAIAPDSRLPSERLRHVPSPLSRREARPESEGHRDDPIPLYVTFVTGTYLSRNHFVSAAWDGGHATRRRRALHSAQENFSVHQARVDARDPFDPSPGQGRPREMSARTADERVLPLCAPGRYPGQGGCAGPVADRSTRFGKRVGYSCLSASIGASCAALRAG